jgi:hypothetical protein
MSDSLPIPTLIGVSQGVEIIAESSVFQFGRQPLEIGTEKACANSADENARLGHHLSPKNEVL